MLLSAFTLNVNGQHSKGELYRGQTYYPNDPLRQPVNQYPQPAYQTQQQTYHQPSQYYSNQQQNSYQNQQQPNYQQQNYQTNRQKNPNQQAYQKPYSVNQQQFVKPAQSNVNYQTVRPLQNSPGIDMRFGPLADDPNASDNDHEITSRRPSNRVSSKPPRPAVLPPRFDDINNRKLVWDEELTNNAEKFALKLFAYLAESEDGNFMISPQSIHNLLVLIAEGASGNTYNELNTVIGLISRQRTRDFHQYSNIALK